MKVREYRADWKCDVLRVVGYVAECGCGWKSQTHPSISTARIALTGHRVACEISREVEQGASA